MICLFLCINITLKNEINETNKDKIFVKNLENVQGDERDVIMFSIGFGYNKDQKFHLFFQEAQGSPRVFP